jgi:hypothetical protein
LPHFKNVFFPVEEYQQLKKNVATCSGLAQGEPVYIQSVQAGFYYLAAEIRNPTPYDYPCISVLGERGEKQIMGMIEKHQIPKVFVMIPNSSWKILWPDSLVNFFKSHMQNVWNSDFCSVYR